MSNYRMASCICILSYLTISYIGFANRELIHCRPSSFTISFPYKIEVVVVSERVKIRDESRVLLVVFARLVAAAHDRAPPCRFYRKNRIRIKVSPSSNLVRRVKLSRVFLQFSFTISLFALHEIGFSRSVI